MRLGLVVMLLTLLQACAPIPRFTEADAATWGSRFDDAFACKRAGIDRRYDSIFTSKDKLETLEHNRQLWIREVQRRNLLTPEEWTLAAQKQVKSGMSVCALYASWGEALKESSVAVPGRVLTLHVYTLHYVHSVNGKVTSWHIL